MVYPVHSSRDMKNTIAAEVAAAKSFRIVNANTGVDFGVYPAADEASALDALALDAGYRSHAWVCFAATEENSYISKVAYCAEIATDVDQDWDEESTTYTFLDGSKLRFSGPEVAAL